mgnify:FL=1
MLFRSMSGIAAPARLACAVLVVLFVAACGPPRPDVGASVGTGGPAARAGVEAGRVNAGVSTGGAYASADVIDTGQSQVTVGTGGVGASTRIGGGPFRVGIGTGGIRLGL